MSSIPTNYRGIRFRSRLEAKWATFFDLCGWPWDYEPVDLRGYIPDFVLHLRRPILVEVKPAFYHNDAAVWNARKKIEVSGWSCGPGHDDGWCGCSVIVGSRLFASLDAEGPKGNPTPAIGVLDCEDMAVIGHCLDCGKVSFSSDMQSYQCELCSSNQGGWPVGTHDNNNPAHSFWTRACNLTQWRPSAP